MFSIKPGRTTSNESGSRMPSNILVDASFLFTLNAVNDKNRPAALAFLKSSRENLLIPEIVLAEVAHVLRQRIGQGAVLNLLDHLVQPEVNLVGLTKTDLQRARQIMATYSSADFDLADCCIMALAERLNITQVCTFDHRDFWS